MHRNPARTIGATLGILIASSALAQGFRQRPVTPPAPNTTAALPTWPQRYELWPEQRQVFLVPVTSPGRVAITVAWQGAPPSVVLSDMQKKTLAQAVGKAGPVQLEHVFTAQEIARAPLCVLIITAPRTAPPPGNSRVVVSGEVAVSSPPVDAARVAAAVQPIRAQTAAHASALAAQRASKRPVLAQPARPDLPLSRARLAELTKQESEVKARFKVATAAVRPGAVEPRKPPLKPVALAPTITRLVPTNGSPGDVVRVYATSLSDPARTSVVMRLGSSAVTAEPTAAPSVDATSGDSIFTVRVPTLATGLSATTFAQVTTSDGGRTPPLVSAPAAFAYDPYPAPTVTAVYPSQIAAKQRVTVNGTRFQAGDLVHFVVPGLGDVAGATVVVSDTQLQATAPDYAASDAGPAQIYVLNRGGKRSGPLAITTVANQSSVSSVFPSSTKPGDTLLLSGKLLGGVSSVMLKVVPRAEQLPSTRYISNALLTAAPQSLTITQKSESAVAVRLPFLTGFSGPLKVTLTVAGAGQPVVAPIVVNPELIQVYYRPPPTFAQFIPASNEDHVTTADQGLLLPWWVSVRHSPGSWFATAWGVDIITLGSRRVATEFGWGYVGTELDKTAMWANAELMGGVVFNATSGRWETTGYNAATGTLTLAVHWSTDFVWNSYGVIFYELTTKLHGPRGVPMLIGMSGTPEYVAPNETIVY